MVHLLSWLLDLSHNFYTKRFLRKGELFFCRRRCVWLRRSGAPGAVCRAAVFFRVKKLCFMKSPLFARSKLATPVRKASYSKCPRKLAKGFCRLFVCFARRVRAKGPFLAIFGPKTPKNAIFAIFGRSEIGLGATRLRIKFLSPSKLSWLLLDFSPDGRMV